MRTQLGYFGKKSIRLDIITEIIIIFDSQKCRKFCTFTRFYISKIQLLYTKRQGYVKLLAKTTIQKVTIKINVNRKSYMYKIDQNFTFLSCQDDIDRRKLCQYVSVFQYSIHKVFGNVKNIEFLIPHRIDYKTQIFISTCMFLPP